MYWIFIKPALFYFDLKTNYCISKMPRDMLKFDLDLILLYFLFPSLTTLSVSMKSN